MTCTDLNSRLSGLHKRYLKLPPEHLTLHIHSPVSILCSHSSSTNLLLPLLLQQQCLVQPTSTMMSSALRPLLVSRLARRKLWRNTNSSVSTFEFVFHHDMSAPPRRALPLHLFLHLQRREPASRASYDPWSLDIRRNLAHYFTGSLHVIS